jgi:hypothetical protein
MSGFAWLNEVMSWLGRWVPRLLLVKRGYTGVKFGPRGSVSTLDAGLHLYWPITHDVTLVSIMPRTFEICAQTHGNEAVGVAVGYRVTDPARSITSVNDLKSNLDDRTQASLAKHVSKQDVADAMLADLKREYEPLGVDIQWVAIIQRGSVITLKNINDWATHEPAGA